ncbi:MAG: 2-oxoglutarate and iron-dependent oxygenase domain-containing protein [Acidobacteriota bacterium]|nr:2-oxoglutarate and iron-dependent oxygenase domain-containing protein [Acidobacteriota bacterium]
MDGLSQVPIINISALTDETSNYEDRQSVAEQIRSAGGDCGFFYTIGHCVDAAILGLDLQLLKILN